MTELQTRLLDMMKWFHSFCEDNDLTYYVLGGTMLGAVRHQGFIPWDDDLDVGLPRKDYERLQILLKQDRDHYHLETPYSPDSNYCYPFSKLYDKTTTLIENTKYDLIRGIYIDVFPLDGIGNNKVSSRINYSYIKLLLSLLTLCSLKPEKSRTFTKRLIVYFFNLVPAKVIDVKTICKRIDHYCKRRNLCDCTFGGNLIGAWQYNEVMNVSVMGNPKKYKFETIDVFGASDGDDYLSSLYGDWKKLPPVEKQVSHHDYYLDLNTPYNEFER